MIFRIVLDNVLQDEHNSNYKLCAQHSYCQRLLCATEGNYQTQKYNNTALDMLMHMSVNNVSSFSVTPVTHFKYWV